MKFFNFLRRLRRRWFGPTTREILWMIHVDLELLASRLGPKKYARDPELDVYFASEAAAKKEEKQKRFELRRAEIRERRKLQPVASSST